MKRFLTTVHMYFIRHIGPENSLLSFNNLELAMSEGNQAYLERTINETRNQVNKNNHLNSVMKQLDQAEVLLENLQLRQNMETALKLKDIWSIELAVRNIMNCSNRNVDLIELAEKGKIYLRNNISHDTAIYNLLNSQNLKVLGVLPWYNKKYM